MKILGLTGHPECVPDLLAAGAEACLCKPADLQELRATVRRLLRLGRSRCPRARHGR